MTFEVALMSVKYTGAGMRLPHWSPEVLIKCQRPDADSEITHPYLYVESRYGKVPWKETFVEMFAENWEVVEC